MADYDESIFLRDASLEEQVRALVADIPANPDRIDVEPFNDPADPEWKLVVDIYPTSFTQQTERTAEISKRLGEQLGVTDMPTGRELKEADIEARGRDLPSTRFTDDLVFRRPGEPVPIHFVSILLAELGLRGAGHDEALGAIRGWLAENEPSSTLRRNLEQSEFAAALQPTDSDRDLRRRAGAARWRRGATARWLHRRTR